MASRWESDTTRRAQFPLYVSPWKISTASTCRGRVLTRWSQMWHYGLEMIETIDTSVRLSKSPLHRPWGDGAGVQRTPAMAIESTDHGWTIQGLLAFPVPPQGQD